MLINMHGMKIKEKCTLAGEDSYTPKIQGAVKIAPRAVSPEKTCHVTIWQRRKKERKAKTYRN